MNNTGRKNHYIMSVLIKIESLDRSQIGPGSIDLALGNDLMSLYPQPVKRQPSVEYIPLPKFKEPKEKA
jgi:hypothetical protein